MQHLEKQVLEYLNAQLAVLPESEARSAVYHLRKAFFNGRERQVKKQLAAMPESQWPETIKAWADANAALEAALHILDTWYESTYASELSALQTAAQSDALQRSLLFASHELLNVIPSFASKNTRDFAKKDRQIAFSILEYLQRGQFKTSPFSRLTTLHLHPLHSAQDAETPEGLPDFLAPSSKASVTPSAALLPAIYEVLLQAPEFCQSLSLCLNPSLQSFDNQYQWLYFDGETEALQQSEATAALRLIAQWMPEATRPYPALLAHLEAHIDDSPEALQAFVFQLIDIGFLEWVLPENGLSANWCSSLYNYLAFLPSSPRITDAAYYLLWLRNTARSLPFQTLRDAQCAQNEALDTTFDFLGKYGVSLLGLRPEQIFYEDVATNAHLNLPDSLLQQRAEQLAQWLSTRHDARAFGFTAQVTQNGQLVVNQVYPAGGKLHSRWLHLFPAQARDDLAAWQDKITAEEDDCIWMLFPWQGWSNANFQSRWGRASLLVPDGKAGAAQGGKNIALRDVETYEHPQLGPQVREKSSQKLLRFIDLGLEATETRPPRMQALWQQGVPDLSWAKVLRQIRHWDSLGDAGFVSQRIEYEGLVLARKTWALKPEAVLPHFSPALSPAQQWLQWADFCSRMGIPRFYFLQFAAEKPQFFDLHSPLSVQLFYKKIKSAAGHTLYLSEMLPTPDDWALEQDGHKKAAELAMEVWRV